MSEFVMVVADDGKAPAFTRRIGWETDSPPDLITIGDDYFVKVGQLLDGKGDRFSYRKAITIDLPTEEELQEALWQQRMGGDLSQ